MAVAASEVVAFAVGVFVGMGIVIAISALGVIADMVNRKEKTE